MKHKKKLATLTAACALSAYGLYPDRHPVYPASDHYDPETQTFFNPEPQQKPTGLAGAFWKILTDPQATRPPKPLPTVKPDWPAFLAAPEGKSRFVWFGHSTLLMRIGGQTVITDPVFGDSVSPVPVMMKRFQPAPVEIGELPPVDVVLISHSHYDHLEKDSVQALNSKGSHFVVSLGMGVLLEKWGVPRERITELDWWQHTELLPTPDRPQSSPVVELRHRTRQRKILFPRRLRPRQPFRQNCRKIQRLRHRLY